MEIHWLEIVLTVVILYGLLKAEYYLRLRRFRARRLPVELRPDESTKGFVSGAVDAVACGRCGTVTKNFYAYADGDKWCRRCDEAEES